MKECNVETKNRVIPWIMVIPALIIPLFFVVVPFFIGIAYSFTNKNVVNPDTTFVGLRNYKIIFSDPSLFLNQLKVTILYAVLAVAIEMLLGFGIALLLNQRIRGQKFFRSAILLPLMAAPVLTALMWKLMLNPSGGFAVVNYFLSAFGIDTVLWLSNPRLVLLTVVGIDVYIYTPFVVIILLAGLQALPREPYEAASIDNAPKLFVFRKLTLPMLKPLILLVLLMRLIMALKMVDTIYVTTKGGPGRLTRTLHVAAYLGAFKQGNIAVALATMTILFIVIFIICMSLVNAMQKKTTEI
jgi:multiple sugar transport system permease protein